MAAAAWLVAAALALLVVLPFLWRLVRAQPRVVGRTVFITGGSEGIGKAIGLDFVRRGANVVLMARTESKLQGAVRELEAARVSEGQRVAFQRMDVTDWSSVQAGIAQAVAAFGPPAFLVTCAGAAHPGYFLEQGPEVFERTMKLNYMGNVHVLKAVTPLMVEQGGGHVMIVASAAAVVSFIGYSSYAPTKFALRGLADSLRTELHGFGVKVSICYPPDTDTPGFKEENKSKPPETQACFPADAFPADKVASQSVASLLKGDYHIQSVDLLQNLLVSSMAGVTPRSFTCLDALLAPLLVLAQAPFSLWFDHQAGGYARRARSQPSGSARAGAGAPTEKRE